MVDYVLGQNKVPVVPHIPWGCASGGWLGTNAKTLNDYIDQHLFTDRPLRQINAGHEDQGLES